MSAAERVLQLRRRLTLVNSRWCVFGRGAESKVVSFETSTFVFDCILDSEQDELFVANVDDFLQRR